jgi:predicted permease
MGFGVGLIVSSFFQLDGVARGVIIIECSMPAAVFNYMLAMKYNNDPDSVAALVVTSTLLTFACLPVLIAFVISL